VAAALSGRWRTWAALPHGLKPLIVLSFVVALGSYMTTPFIAVILVNDIGMGARTAGVLVASATFIQFGGSIVGGAVADRLGLKRTMVAALALRSSGLALLAVSVHVHAVATPAVLLVAVGPALYLPANKAYVVSSVAADIRPLFLSISNAALNAGMGIGPFIAALLLAGDPMALLLGLAALFTAITVAHQLALGSAPHAVSVSQGGGTGSGGGSGALRDAMRPILFNGLAFYLYFFFQSYVGLYAASTSQLGAVGWVMLVNCAMVVVLQPPLSNVIARADFRLLLTGSFLVMAAGMNVMARGGDLMLLLGTVLFTVGEIFLFVRGDLEVVHRLPDRPAFAFGVQRLTAGAGGLFAGLVGGVLFGLFDRRHELGTFWNAVAIQCLVAAVLAVFFVGGSRRRTDVPAPEAGADAEPDTAPDADTDADTDSPEDRAPSVREESPVIAE
jgi:MFS family permease